MKNSQNKTNKLQTIIEVFRNRSKNRRNLALSCLFLIILLIGSGVLLFLYAGQIVSSESREERWYSRLETFDKSINAKEQEINRIFNEYVNATENSFKPNKKGAKELAEINRQGWESLKKFYNRPKQIEYWDDRQELLTEFLKKLKSQKQSFQLEKAELFQIISTVLTRFGVVILLLFLVKILVPLYRYNTKLSAFYDARADALEMFLIKNEDINEDSIKKLTIMLSPDSVDWGSSPNTPTDLVVDLAKSIVERSK